MNPDRSSLPFRKVFTCLVAGAVLTCALFTNSTFAQTNGPVRITLDEAVQMALQHNHNILAARTTIAQSEAMEVTANLRPNPYLFTDWDYLPLFTPSSMNATYLHDLTEADLGFGYLIERGKSASAAIRPPKTRPP